MKAAQHCGGRAFGGRRGGHAVHSEAPGHDVRDAGVEKADPQEKHEDPPGRAPLASQDLERVPGPGDEAELGEGDGEEDAEDAQGVEGGDEEAREQDHPGHVALGVLHLVPRRAHQLEAEGVVEQHRQVDEGVAPPRQEASQGEVVGRGAAREEGGDPEGAQGQEERDLDHCPQIGDPLRDLEAHDPDADRDPGEGDRDARLEPGRSRSVAEGGAEVVLQEDGVEDPREDHVDGRDPIRVVDPVEPGGEAPPARTHGLAHPDVEAPLPGPGRPHLGGDQAIGAEKEAHGEGPPGEPADAHARRGGEGVDGEDGGDREQEQVGLPQDAGEGVARSPGCFVRRAGSFQPRSAAPRRAEGHAVQEIAAVDRAKEAELAVAAVGHAAEAQYQPIGCSLRLMWTCLTWRYSSAPQGPSSRPMPLIL